MVWNSPENPGERKNPITITDDWIIRKNMKRMLGDVCRFYSGTGFPVMYQGKDSGELPFFKVGDIANNVSAGNVYLSFCNNFISRQDAAEIKGTIIPTGTVVFAKIGEALKLNRRAITSCDCLIDNNAMGVAPNQDVLRTGYFFYFMKKLRMQDHAESTTVPSVRKSKLEQVEIEVPSMDEQIEIEKILDKTSSVILMRQKELKALDDLIKARFVEMFGDPISNPKGWNMVELGELTGIGSSKRIFEKEYVSAGVPFYRTKEIVELSKGHNISTELFITEERFAEIKEQYGVPKAGDLLISAVGTIGVIWIVDGKNDFYFKDGNLIRVFGKCRLCIARYKEWPGFWHCIAIFIRRSEFPCI